MRTEIKYYLTMRQYHLLRHAFEQVMERDKNSANGPYTVTSLYFDDMQNSDYHDCVGGVSERKKHRIRFYNQDLSHIRFEKKHKIRDKGSKQTFSISEDEFQQLIHGNADFLRSEHPLKMETYYYHEQKLMRPKVVVSYDREAYVLPYDDIRITFDYKLRCDDYFEDLLNHKDASHYVELETPMILEVKYNSFIPNHIKAILQTQPLTKISISKYALSRNYLTDRKKGLL